MKRILIEFILYKANKKNILMANIICGIVIIKKKKMVFKNEERGEGENDFHSNAFFCVYVYLYLCVSYLLCVCVYDVYV